jgi:hypothetical protein
MVPTILNYTAPMASSTMMKPTSTVAVHARAVRVVGCVWKTKIARVANVGMTADALEAMVLMAVAVLLVVLPVSN